MASLHSFQGSTSFSFNNVSRSILLFVRAPLRVALTGKARSSTLPLRRLKGREFETNSLSCFRLCSASSRKSLKGLPIDTLRYLYCFSIYGTIGIQDVYDSLSDANKFRTNNLEKSKWR